MWQIRKLGEIWKKLSYLMESVTSVIAAYNLLSKEIQRVTLNLLPFKVRRDRSLLEQHGFDKEIDSFILIENQKIYLKSSAALRVCRNLNGLWKLLTILRILPAPFRDFFYDVVAKNRYKWFGKKESCMLPTKEMKKRFLELK